MTMKSKIPERPLTDEYYEGLAKLEEAEAASKK